MKKVFLLGTAIFTFLALHHATAQQRTTGADPLVVTDANGLLKPGTYRGEIPRPRDGKWVHAFDLIVAEAGNGTLSVKNVFRKGKRKECRHIAFPMSGVVNADGSIHLESKAPGCERAFKLQIQKDGRINGVLVATATWNVELVRPSPW